jgi:hypothetical protein
VLPSTVHLITTAAAAITCFHLLQIQLGPKRVLPLIRFRGAVRPVIIAGDRSFVERCIKEGEQRLDQLRARGVSGELLLIGIEYMLFKYTLCHASHLRWQTAYVWRLFGWFVNKPRWLVHTLCGACRVSDGRQLARNAYLLRTGSVWLCCLRLCCTV